MIEEKGFDKPEKFEIDGFWWNNYQAGGNTRVHKHSRSDWSGIYLLHLEEPNTTTFIAQYGEAPNTDFMNKNKTMDEVTEGHVMIFPSFLLHYAQPSVKNRIIISFDVICPRSPWLAFAASKKNDGVPVEEKVAAHFLAIIPLFPTPDTIILPFLQFNIVFMI